jgi:hypothetical protein
VESNESVTSSSSTSSTYPFTFSADLSVDTTFGNLYIELSVMNWSMTDSFNGLIVKIPIKDCNSMKPSSNINYGSMAIENEEYVWTFQKSIPANGETVVTVPFVSNKTTLSGNLPISISTIDNPKKVWDFVITPNKTNLTNDNISPP